MKFVENGILFVVNVGVSSLKLAVSMLFISKFVLICLVLLMNPNSINE
jgi:hypothetical protein